MKQVDCVCFLSLSQVLPYLQMHEVRLLSDVKQMVKRNVRPLVSTTVRNGRLVPLLDVLTNMKLTRTREYGTSPASTAMALYFMTGQDSLVHRIGSTTVATQHGSLARNNEGDIFETLPTPVESLRSNLRSSLSWLQPVLADASLSDEQVDLLFCAMHCMLGKDVHATAEMLERAACVSQIRPTSSDWAHLAGVLHGDVAQATLDWMSPSTGGAVGRNAGLDANSKASASSSSSSSASAAQP